VLHTLQITNPDFSKSAIFYNVNLLCTLVLFWRWILISPQRLSSRDLHYHGAMEDAAAR
jgi:hypothetical protein